MSESECEAPLPWVVRSWEEAVRSGGEQKHVPRTGNGRHTHGITTKFPKHSPAIVMVCNAGTENGAGKGTDPALSHDPASFDYRATTRLIIPTRRDARLKRARQRTIIQCPVSSRSEFRLPLSLSLSLSP